MAGPLEGVRIVEMAGIGPGPFCGMMLADHGAEVIRIERPGPESEKFRDVMNRSRRSIVVDVKKPGAVDVIRDICRGADGLIEGYRPGVMERLGLGPDVLLNDNPKLVFGRMTGWGQTGPMAQAAGHDINYISLTGALHALGRADEKPPIPLNLVGDFGGGGMLLAFGMVSAILSARTTGRGQVVDCAMTEGASLLASMFFSMVGSGTWDGSRGTNFLSGAAPFYSVYETADGEYVSLGSIEPQFYAELLRRLGLSEDPDFQNQNERSYWPAMAAKLTTVMKSRTREEWRAAMEGSDVCFAPVVSFAEAPKHPHNVARGSFVEAFGIVQPAPAPRYSESRTTAPSYTKKGGDADAVLLAAGLSTDRIAELRAQGVLG
jgi:alpha-methylacyl-CoA racemase